MPTDIRTTTNHWDHARDFPTGELIKLANKIGPQDTRPVTDMFGAIKRLHYICFVAKCLNEIEAREPKLKDYGYNPVAQVIDEYVEEQKLPSHWKQGLFEPTCAAVRTLKKGKVPWYRQETYRWKTKRNK